MKVLIPSFLIAATALAASPASANWQWTQWGMAPAQVIAASGGTVHAGSNPNVLEGAYTAGGRTYAATFQFLNGGLAKVELKLAGTAACESMTTDLANIYGKPDRTAFGNYGIGVGEWLDRSNGNDVVVSFLVQKCSVAYAPLATAASQGL
jgi:hypothetical protein